MRGLISAHIMTRIEEITGLRMAEMVDVFSGPSTGSILNAALNVPHPEDATKPKYKARHMVKFYEREGVKIFPPDRFRDFRALLHDFNNRTMKISKLRDLMRHGHYDPGHLGYCLRALYGDTKLADSLSSLVIPVYNLDGDHLDVVPEQGEDDDTQPTAHTHDNFGDRGGYAVWLKNIHFRRHKQKTPNVSLYDAIMASTAAPTYFPSHSFDVTYDDQRGTKTYAGIDGSIFDNPCISYHGAIRQHVPDDTRVIMIALGTGHTARSFKHDEWNSYGGLGVVDPVNDLPLINIMFHAPETALIESFKQELGDDFYVFNKSLITGDDAGMPSTQIDDASPENLTKIERFFEETLEENKTSSKKSAISSSKTATKKRKRNSKTKRQTPLLLPRHLFKG